MDEQFEEAVDTAWAEFRKRLADRLAGLGEDEIFRVEVETGVDEVAGAAPYLQFVGEEDVILAEAVSNFYLDERFRLDEEIAGSWFVCGLWEDPSDDEPNYHQWVERREADRLAVTCVQVLREVYGVAHPAFLDAEGLEADGGTALPASDQAQVEEDEPLAMFPHDREALQQAVDAAMQVMFPDLKHDGDGDIPVLAGQSVLFVRVLDERPAVEVFAEIVLEPTDQERLVQELALLNEMHRFARFARKGDVVVMSFQLIAHPFAPAQLRAVVAQMCEEVDDIARMLAVRVGGRRFLEPEAEPARVDLHPGMTELLELLHLGRVASSTVAAAFGRDRAEIIRMLVMVREGHQGCGDHDQDVVLDHLRRGLRHVVDGRSGERGRRPVPPRPRSRQEPLLSDVEVGIDTLDLGRSA